MLLISCHLRDASCMWNLKIIFCRWPHGGTILSTSRKYDVSPGFLPFGKCNGSNAVNSSGENHKVWKAVWFFFSVPSPRVNSDLVFSVKNIFRCALHVYCMDSITLVSHRTLQVNYKASGWVVHHVSDIWAKTSALQGNPVWALWPMGGAWLCTHLWEHYAYTADKVSNLFLYLCPFGFLPLAKFWLLQKSHTVISPSELLIFALCKTWTPKLRPKKLGFISHYVVLVQM